MNQQKRTVLIATILAALAAVAALLGHLNTEATGGITLALCAMILMHITHPTPDPIHQPVQQTSIRQPGQTG